MTERRNLTTQVGATNLSPKPKTVTATQMGQPR